VFFFYLLKRALPVIDSRTSVKTRDILAQIQKDRPRYLQLQIVRHQLDSHLEVEFANLLVEDANHDAMSYVDYLCFIHR
jgi:protein transport protein SEC24